MAITKPQIIDALTEAGIEHDPSAKVADLKALLPEDHPLVTSAPETSAPASDREARWQAFLEKAKDNPLFQMQKENGEFDVIPDSFE